jgi:hypothetical protein
MRHFLMTDLYGEFNPVCVPETKCRTDVRLELNGDKQRAQPRPLRGYGR